ncbi:transcriptional regulator BetI [Kiloniella sp. EL199]|uniref:transcriptional regulator BetI n=1 Tax=Kiloniella sp. EL199 TaxID=2107581 RepID=UPI000EA01D8E|nr:transcriptional regulator BetI [Kiloniella sp. EL199]
MPKVGMEAIRKKQLIEATISSIHERGYSDTTIRLISQKAGVSTGIVHHYFKDKDDLLRATMQSMLSDLRLSVLKYLEQATTPKEQIEALISAYLDAHLFEPETVSAWLAFWAHVPHSKDLSRLQNIYEKRQISTFKHIFKKLLQPENVESASLGLVALIDGLWVRTSLLDSTQGREIAKTVALDYFEMLLQKENR